MGLRPSTLRFRPWLIPRYSGKNCEKDSPVYFRRRTGGISFFFGPDPSFALRNCLPHRPETIVFGSGSQLDWNLSRVCLQACRVCGWRERKEPWTPTRSETPQNKSSLRPTFLHGCYQQRAFVPFMTFHPFCSFHCPTRQWLSPISGVAFAKWRRLSRHSPPSVLPLGPSQHKTSAAGTYVNEPTIHLGCAVPFLAAAPRFPEPKMPAFRGAKGHSFRRYHGKVRGSPIVAGCHQYASRGA